MNRMALESIASGRRASVGSQLQQLRGCGGKFAGGDADDGLDLFSRARRSDGDPLRLEKVSVGSTRIGRGMEDLLDAEIGKHDYDWLLTPPETPLYHHSAVSRESPLSSTTPPARESPASSTTTRGRPAVRSVSNTRPSRLSASQTENGHSTRPVRSSSVTRPSISGTYSCSSFSNNNNRTSVLNTSSASVTSSRPSTPGSRSATSRPSSTSISARPSSNSAATRPSLTSNASRPSSASSTARSTSTSRPVPSRLPTPTRTRPNPTTSGDRTTRPLNNSRPSTPTSCRPQTHSNPSSRANSRPATPTRRPTSSAGSSTSNTASRFPSVGRISAATTRNPAAPASRPSSPGPRPRAPVRPIDLPDFPVDAPPNLRTKLPERPASAGRTRPGMALIVRANSNSDVGMPATTAAAAPPSSNRRNYMPVVRRGRFPENPPRTTAKLDGNNGHEVAAAPEIQKISDGGLRRPAKPVSATESTGFGRTISKKSIDMAVRHMDIRQGMGGIRASSLFPQSIRSTSTRGRPARKSDPVVPLTHGEAMLDNYSCNGTISPDCKSSISIAHSENGDFASAMKSPDRASPATRASELDLHGSSRYDAFLLKEDSRNMNWLHSVDRSDQSPVFDHRFEPLPEPFGLL